MFVRTYSFTPRLAGRALLGLTLVLALVAGAAAPAGAQSATQRLLEAKRRQEAQADTSQGSTQAGGTQGQAQSGDVVTIEATGVASYYPDDAARSRNEAIEAAQQDAVEQASGVLISSESLMRNFDLVQDDVLSRSEGFIRNYEVISEGVDGPFYNVTIRAEVVKRAFIEGVNASLENLYRRVGKPRVMLSVEEVDLTRPAVLDEEGKPVMQAAATLNVVEKEIRKLLLAQGFTFIDARALKSGTQVEQAEKGRDTSRASLLDLAQTTKAELVMIGKGQISSLNRLNKFYVVEASVGLDVIRSVNGQVMASEVKLAKGLHVNQERAAIEALQKAADEITPAVMEQVTFQWIRERSEGTRVELVVQNASYGDLITFRRTLANAVKGVQKVQQRSFSEGTALLEVSTKDPPDRLAESLYTTRFPDFDIEILDVTAQSVVVQIKR